MTRLPLKDQSSMSVLRGPKVLEYGIEAMNLCLKVRVERIYLNLKAIGQFSQSHHFQVGGILRRNYLCQGGSRSLSCEVN